MHFSIQLSAYYPDKSYGGERIYRDMLEQAHCADQSGYESVSITEHHLINILMMAVLAPEAIYHCTKRGFHIQTTPLSGDHQHMLDQVNAFNRAKAELGDAGAQQTLSLSRVAFLSHSDVDRNRKIQLAHDYYSRFDNVFTGPGIVETLGTFVTRWFTDAFITAHPELIEARLQQVKDTPADVFLNVFWIYATTEMAPWLHQLKCPCLVLTGEFDGGCNPRLNEFMHGELSDSRLVILEGLKHALMIEASDKVLPPLREFLLEQS